MNSLPDGGQELETASRKLLGILQSADHEYDEALPPQQKQAIWSVIAGALRVFASTQCHDSKASLGLHNALVSLSEGEQGEILTGHCERSWRGRKNNRDAGRR